jgi:succinoglycan biosynthesis protein ExoM
MAEELTEPKPRLHKASSETTVDVCVCSFRRPSLRRTLESLARQSADGGVRMRVIVADNDDAPSAEAIAARAREELGLDLLYIHAPARNISIARNACLDAARAEYVAFIDDDEEAHPQWLGELLRHLVAADLDVVFGPVNAVYGPEAPAWMVKGDFLSVRPAFRANGEIDAGYTGNVLLRRNACGAQRFDPALGNGGGEDTYFFTSLHRRGARLGYCESAVVTEATAPTRTNLRWRLLRAYRGGQVHFRALRERGEGRARIALVAGAKVLYCGLAALLTAYSPVGWRKSLVRGALHAGVLAKLCGAGDVALYGGA